MQRLRTTCLSWVASARTGQQSGEEETAISMARGREWRRRGWSSARRSAIWTRVRSPSVPRAKERSWRTRAVPWRALVSMAAAVLRVVSSGAVRARSWEPMRMGESMLLRSWAMPPVREPMLSRRWLRSRRSARARGSVTSVLMMRMDLGWFSSSRMRVRRLSTTSSRPSLVVWRISPAHSPRARVASRHSTWAEEGAGVSRVNTSRPAASAAVQP